ncbi:MAG: ABC transporter permease [Methanomassiliicoccaceae archaeon]|jgi:ABC-2 type transport system permease protein|nr:ABC transporter permease [Methanomassiliicoccaceae archaeon]
MAKGIGDDMRQIGVVTKYEILKHLRSKRMLIFIAIAVILFALMTALVIILDGKLPDDPTEFMKQYLAIVIIMIIIGTSLICAPAIASEFEERTALLMFPRPMKKTSFFIGKVLACYIVCGAVIVLYYLICIVLSFICTGGLDLNTFGSLGMALLFMMGAGGFGLLMSSMFKKGSTSIIVTILVLLLVFYSMIDGLLIMFEVEPFFSLTYAGLDILNFVAGDPTGIQIIETPMGPVEMMFYYPSHALAVSVMATWAIVTTALAALLFRRREF